MPFFWEIVANGDGGKVKLEIYPPSEPKFSVLKPATDHMRSIIHSIRRTPLPTIYRRQHVNFHASQYFSARGVASSALLREKTLEFDAMKDVDRRLQMTFTCTAENCGHRSTHQFSARAYNSGIVLLTCPSCKNRCVQVQRYGETEH
jgi:DNL zinc finger